MTKILVYYYIQNDAWESLKEPNVYALEKKYSNAGEVSVKDTYDCFPIKNQKYFLRYFIDDSKQNLKGWLDLPPSAKAPVYNDKVYVKALRIPQEVNLNFKNDLYKKSSNTDQTRTKTNSNVNSSNQSSHLGVDNNFKQQTSKSPNKVISNNHPNINKQSNNSQINMQTQKFNSQGGQKELINMQKKEPKLINFENEIKFQESKTDDPYNINNIDLDSIIFHDEKKTNSSSPQKIDVNMFNEIPSNINIEINKSSPKKEAATNNDFDLASLGLNFGTTTTQPTGNIGQGKAANDSTTSNIPSFPKEILLFDLPPLNADPNSLDNFAIREMCDPVINYWAGIGGYEKKNIRMLLSTLHEIWRGDGWTKLSLGDVLEDNKLKKAYSRAILQIHPDKIHSTDPRMKYCAERVCNLITESYSESKR